MAQTKEERAAVMKVWRQKNAVRIKAVNDVWRAANKERIARVNKVWYQDNKEKAAVSARNWRLSNGVKRSTYRASYRASKLGQTPDMSRAELVEIEAMYLYNQIMPGVWHVDHIQPISKGGLHHPSNLQILSEHDNLTKSASYA